jgi:DNA-binding transcriptional regulator YiaG
MTLRAWVEREGKDVACETLGIRRQTLWAWLTGRCAPRPQERDLLSRRTGREVSPDGFGPQEVSR